MPAWQLAMAISACMAWGAAAGVQPDADAATNFIRVTRVRPAGWYCTFSAAPATVSQLPDGRIRLDYWDDRPEAVDVLLKARRRVAQP